MDTQKTYALKFISGKYQGGEFPLKVDKQIVIGRSSELDMVLVEDMVSRKHAKISFSDGKITIEDLGSTNGTFVNGEKVKQARLKEGDRILIGTSILKLVHQGADGANVDESMAKQKLEEVAAVQAARTTNKASSMTGKIEEIPLPDLLQLFHTSKKNGVLVVTSDQEGRIYLRQGRVYYAVIGDNHNLGPQKSFNRIITWEQGDFELRPADNQEFMVELDSSTEALLMDSLRQLDEMKRLQPSLPALDAPLALAMPLTPPLKELAPEMLDVLQLVHNYGTLGAVLDRADADDVVTAEAVAQLLKRDYVRKA
ncbi:FHA domain-containing protein [Pyxidicoccus trucidator]|uniref:FHA domain-containing protein n=1 Tax=Pyxidicoccus trucidator TaxID=2709662 RepID=UPI0013D9EB3C|nr:FHA domain-containing protein [Pyxidicoccus trucidator]